LFQAKVFKEVDAERGRATHTQEEEEEGGGGGVRRREEEGGGGGGERGKSGG